MPRYKFLRKHNNHSAGEIAEFPAGNGTYLVRVGAAMEVKDEMPPVLPAEEAKPKGRKKK